MSDITNVGKQNQFLGKEGVRYMADRF